jgi:hypothetical protein
MDMGPGVLAGLFRPGGISLVARCFPLRSRLPGAALRRRVQRLYINAALSSRAGWVLPELLGRVRKGHILGKPRPQSMFPSSLSKLPYLPGALPPAQWAAAVAAAMGLMNPMAPPDQTTP